MSYISKIIDNMIGEKIEPRTAMKLLNCGLGYQGTLSHLMDLIKEKELAARKHPSLYLKELNLARSYKEELKQLQQYYDNYEDEQCQCGTCKCQD